MRITRKCNKKGFSLIEMMVAMLVSSVIILSVVATFASIVKARKKSTEIQRNLEGVSSTMDLMSKTIRMSTNVVSIGAAKRTVYMYNNSLGLCIAYSFASSQLQEARCVPIDPDNIDKCKVTRSCDADGDGNADAYQFTALTDQVIDSGTFDVVPSSATKIGKTTMRLTIDGKDLQTTVSMRDYQGLGN